MYRWTTSTPVSLPIFHKTTYTFCHSTIIGTNIWLIFGFNGRRGFPLDCMFVMDTDINRIYNIEYIAEFTRSSVVQCFTSDGTNLYMVRQNREEREDELHDYTIYVMDTTNEDLTWREVMEFSYSQILDACQIIEDTLYLLCESPIKLIAIDLTHKKPMKVVFVMEGEMNLSGATLTKNNGKLHIIVQKRDCRTVIILENDGELRIVKENPDVYDYDDECTFVENGNRVFYKQDFDKSISLESYDIDNNDWIKINVESTIKKQKLKLALEHDDKIFVVVRSDWNDRYQHDIRVLDLKPRLSDLCWMNVVDDVVPRNNTERFQEIRSQLPGPLRCQMDAVVNWRIIEQEKDRMRKLLKKRYYHMSNKIYELGDDEEITEDQVAQLDYLFKKDLAYNDQDYYVGIEEDDSDLE